MQLINGVDSVFQHLFEKRQIIENEKLWEKIMERITLIMNSYGPGTLAMLNSRSVYNSGKNRYLDILPYEFNRVQLTKTPENITGYINASHIELCNGNFRYIMAGAPPVLQFAQFWKMVVEQKVPGIVMLTKEREDWRIVADAYYPLDEGEGKKYGEHTVLCLKKEVGNGFIIRHIRVRDSKKTIHKLIHFQYLDWHDREAPEDVEKFIQFYDKVTETKILDPTITEKEGKKRTLFCRLFGNHSDESPPSYAPIVHCSAGVGRSGAFILIDVLMRSLKNNTSGTYCIEELVLELRKQRIKSVNSGVQLEFIYNCLLFYCTSQNKKLTDLILPLNEHALLYYEKLGLQAIIYAKKWTVTDEFTKQQKSKEKEPDYVEMKYVYNPMFDD